MSDQSKIRGHGVVMQPDDGPTFWQPVPANGHVEPKLYPSNTHFDGLSMGYQTIAPASQVRKHSHEAQIELLVCFGGRGRVVLDGESHDFVPGTVCFAGYDLTHEIINESPSEDLVLMWVIAPAGLEDFFATIGRPRTRGEAAPEPFARPESVVAIEREMGMNDTTAQ
jgi:quercetin dioxygenase-like cupin family protein